MSAFGGKADIDQPLLTNLDLMSTRPSSAQSNDQHYPSASTSACPTSLWPRFYYALLVNGAWGFGTALFLKLFGEARKDTARA